MLRLAFDFIITWRETRTRPNAYFSANTAGKNWILANQPNHPCNVPVKSRNNKVMSTKQIIAKVSLIFRNMIILYFEFLNYISDMSTKQLPK